jgi:hypothetical protein
MNGNPLLDAETTLVGWTNRSAIRNLERTVLRQAPWPIRDNQVGRWVSLMAPRLSPATTWGRRHEN